MQLKHWVIMIRAHFTTLGIGHWESAWHTMRIRRDGRDRPAFC